MRCRRNKVEEKGRIRWTVLEGGGEGCAGKRARWSEGDVEGRVVK